MAGNEEDIETMAHHLFLKYDADKTGSIDHNEIRQIFSELKIQTSKDDLDALVAARDQG